MLKKTKQKPFINANPTGAEDLLQNIKSKKEKIIVDKLKKKNKDIVNIQIESWLLNIKKNIDKSIQNLKYNCSYQKRQIEYKNIQDQLRMIKIIKQVKNGKTILQGYNFNK
jgi:hypothetical protein